MHPQTVLPDASGGGDALLTSEPYEMWHPLAVKFLDAPTHPRKGRGSYVSCTRLLRTGRDSLWRGLRKVLDEHGLTPADMVLVYLLQCGTNIESGVVLSDGGRVYDFDLRHVQVRADSGRMAKVLVERWNDITDRWQMTPFGSEIADAFIWRPPSRRTILTVTGADDERDVAVLPA